MERAGYLAAVMAGRRPATQEDGTVDPKIRKAIAEAIARINGQRADEVGKLVSQLKALDADDGRDAGWKDRERARLTKAITARNAAARGELAKVTEPLVADARTRLATGTPLESSALAEASLVVQEYTGKTKIERRHVAAEAAEALAAGAVDRARTLHRAAVALGVAEDATAKALDEQDPMRRGATEDLSALVGIEETFEAGIAAELASATGDVSSSIAAKAAAHLAGMGQPAPGAEPAVSSTDGSGPGRSGAEFAGHPVTSRGDELRRAQEAGDVGASIAAAADLLST